MTRNILKTLGIILTGFMIASPAIQAEDTALNDAQKKEITSILEQHLKDNPKIVIDAIENYQRQEQMAEEEKAKKSINDNLAALTDESLPFIGNKDGDVTVVEFFDYNCGYCKRAIPDIRAILEEDKNVKFVFKEMPILGPSSRTAAQYALAAQKQGKYFDYHAALMEHRGPKDEGSLEKIAKDLDLNVDQMKKDANSKEISDAIEKSIALAGDIGVRGTPAFIVESELFRGYLGEDGLKAEIEKARKK